LYYKVTFTYASHIWTIVSNACSCLLTKQRGWTVSGTGLRGRGSGPHYCAAQPRPTASCCCVGWGGRHIFLCIFVVALLFDIVVHERHKVITGRATSIMWVVARRVMIRAAATRIAYFVCITFTRAAYCATAAIPTTSTILFMQYCKHFTRLRRFICGYLQQMFYLIRIMLADTCLRMHMQITLKHSGCHVLA
jgi:hypothetical protein